MRLPKTVKKAWTQKYMVWMKDHVRFDQPALQATLRDYMHEVDHAGERIQRLDNAIDKAVVTAPESIRAVVAALQALRGIARMTAVTIVSEVGSFSRFKT